MRILLAVLMTGTLLFLLFSSVTGSRLEQQKVNATPTAGRFMPLVYKPENTPTPTATHAPLLQNGDFEQGPQIWIQQSVTGRPLIHDVSTLPIQPHGGNWMAWFEMEGIPTNYILSQEIYVPENYNFIAFWYWTDNPFYFSELFFIACPGGTFYTTPQRKWIQHFANIADCRDQNMLFQIGMIAYPGLPAHIYVDDIQLYVERPLGTSNVDGPVGSLPEHLLRPLR